MPNVTEIRCKQALHRINKSDLPQQWDLNLYRGCQHGCVYCFAMYSHDYINPNSNYYDDLYVKVNIAEQLERQLRSPNWKGETIAIAGVTDCYQPIEAKYKLMPEILKVMIKYKNPVSITTKSDLILRDYDLLDELSRVAEVNINASIVAMDNDIRRKIEPAGRNADKKFNMLKEFSKTNATTGMLQMPIIPYITDSRENIEALYSNARDANVNYIVPGMLYLKGKTRGVFFDFIKREFPDLFVPLTKIYQKGSPVKKGYRTALYQMIRELRKKYRLSNYYTKEVTSQQDEIAEIKKVADGFQQLSLFETDTAQTYQATPIPNRDQLIPRQAPKTTSASAKSDLASFVEIEMGSEVPHYSSVTIPATEPIETGHQPIREKDEKRALFYSMRQIARNTNAYADHSKIFYDQAQFMKDFEDDYAEAVSFSSYFPYYQRMGYEQLRSYFTWRTEVRKGNISTTSTSFAFLYIYELLNLVGVADPEVGLNKLMIFWQSFREYDRELDQHVLLWLKDYHIYYPVPQTFAEFSQEQQLILHYPTVFGYTSDKQNSFDLFVDISKYDIKNSVFYSDETHALINDCFYFILEHLRKTFKEQGQCFEDLIFYPLTKEVAWTPFNRALFYPAFKQAEREVSLSEKEVYRYHENQWHYKSVMLADNGRLLVGYVMKEMEASLRQVVKFKYKITANLSMCDDKSLATFARMGIVLPDLIRACVNEFYTEFTRKIITVDVGNLQQIRRDALQTQEKLIVPEANEQAVVEIKTPTQQVATEPTLSIEENVELDPWNELKNALTEIELEALALLIDGQQIKEFAMKKMVMLEVLVDGINDKAMDFVGDAILELDDEVMIYEEYVENLIAILSI